jgi:hypothetical protein
MLLTWILLNKLRASCGIVTSISVYYTCIGNSIPNFNINLAPTTLRKTHVPVNSWDPIDVYPRDRPYATYFRATDFDDIEALLFEANPPSYQDNVRLLFSTIYHLSLQWIARDGILSLHPSEFVGIGILGETTIRCLCNYLRYNLLIYTSYRIGICRVI